MSNRITFNEDQAKESVDKLKETGSDTARMVISDEKDVVDETNVTVPKDSVKVFADGQTNLEIFSENVRITIPYTSLANMDEELYFPHYSS